MAFVYLGSVCVSDQRSGWQLSREACPCDTLAPKREGEAEKPEPFIIPAGQQPVTTATTTPKTGIHPHRDHYLQQI